MTFMEKRSQLSTLKQFLDNLCHPNGCLLQRKWSTILNIETFLVASWAQTWMHCFEQVLTIEPFYGTERTCKNGHRFCCSMVLPKWMPLMTKNCSTLKTYFIENPCFIQVSTQQWNLVLLQHDGPKHRCLLWRKVHSIETIFGRDTIHF